MLRVKYDYESTDYKSYWKKWVNAFCEVLVTLVSWLEKVSSVGLAQDFIVAIFILGLRLRITGTGHLVVVHQNLLGSKAVPLQYRYKIFRLHITLHMQYIYKGFYFYKIISLLHMSHFMIRLVLNIFFLISIKFQTTRLWSARVHIMLLNIVHCTFFLLHIIRFMLTKSNELKSIIYW